MAIALAIMTPKVENDLYQLHPMVERVFHTSSSNNEVFLPTNIRGLIFFLQSFCFLYTYGVVLHFYRLWCGIYLAISWGYFLSITSCVYLSLFLVIPKIIYKGIKLKVTHACDICFF